MVTFTERRLQITVTGAIDAWKFDDPSTHRMSCMKAVDFIIELDNHYVFIEFKDPQHPNAQDRNQQEFIRDLQSGQIDEELKYKYRDSFLYEWALGRAKKPVDYFVLVALDSLTSADLIKRTDTLRSKLPLHGPNGQPWPIVRGCAVFNLESWNRNLPQYPVSPLL